MSFSYSIESFGKRGGGGDEYLLMNAKSLVVANIIIPYFF